MGPIVTTSLGGPGGGDLRPVQMTLSTEQAAFNRSVATAAGVVNSSGSLGENREITFSVDPATHRPIVRVMDINTHEVIDQWPPEYVLQMAAQAKTLARDSG